MLKLLFVVVLVTSCYGRAINKLGSEKWKYLGCYKDATLRDLTSAHKGEADDVMTIQWCYDFCDGYKSMYMGLQEGDECRCDNGYGRYGPTDEVNCDEPCDGNETETCGGGWANSVYQIRDKPPTEITADMMTLSSNEKLVFTALGDWGQENDVQKKVAQALGEWSEKHGSSFTAAVGDNFYDSGVKGVDDKKFQTTWRDVYTHKGLQNPWLVVEGNHDYKKGRAMNQVKYMYAKLDSRWVMPSLYYSMHYDVGGQDVHFIFLDTDPIFDQDEYHQFNWFRQEIGNSNADWIIVIGHHPVVSSGSHGSQTSTESMYNNIRHDLVKNKAALYICGHDHFLEHLTDESGIVDYVISGSGAKLDDEEYLAGVQNVQRKGATSSFLNKTNGFVGLELKGNTVKVTYIDKDEKELYSFTKFNPRGTDASVIG